MSLTPHQPHALAAPASRVAVPAGADPTYFLPKLETGRLLGILIRRGWIVVLLTLLGAVALYLYASKLPKTYRANGAVYVNTQAPVVMNIRAVAPEETRDLEQLRSVEQAMSGPSLLMEVIKANHLAEDPAFAPAGASDPLLLGIFAGRVQVALRRGTRIIDLQVEDHDPARARQLVESLFSEYETWTNARQLGITQQASEGLQREEQRLRGLMEASAAKLQKFREAHPIPGLEGSGTTGPVSDSLTALSARLTDATATRLKLEAEFETFAKFDASNPQALAGLQTSERGTEVLAQVKAIQQKETDFARIKERYLYKHPIFKEADRELKTMRANLAETVRAAGQALDQRYRIAKDNEQKLAAEVAAARGTAVDSEVLREQFRTLSRDAEGDRALHDSVATRLRETTLASSVPASVLRWEDRPMVPEKPASPRKIVFAGVGGFLGFLVGLLLLVALQFGDRRVRDAAGVSRATGAPLLGTLPPCGKSGEGIVLLTDPSSAGAEAFRRLRAILAPPADSNSSRTLLFASSKAGEGKSFCALNYAASLAMQGHRTLLLDADLRHPGLSRDHLSGNGPESGLGGYLAGNIDAASACYTTALENLYLLSSGPLREDAAELLAGTRLPALLEDAFRWFDRVVIDTPAVLATSDMLALARYADCTCLVVRGNTSDRRELKRTAELIRAAGGTLVGFIWNQGPATAGTPDSAGPGAPVGRPSIAASPAAKNSSGLVKNFR